jgi:hypothetical protein
MVHEPAPLVSSETILMREAREVNAGAVLRDDDRATGTA